MCKGKEELTDYREWDRKWIEKSQVRERERLKAID